MRQLNTSFVRQINPNGNTILFYVYNRDSGTEIEVNTIVNKTPEIDKAWLLWNKNRFKSSNIVPKDDLCKIYYVSPKRPMTEGNLEKISDKSWFYDWMIKTYCDQSYVKDPKNQIMLAFFSWTNVPENYTDPVKTDIGLVPAIIPKDVSLKDLAFFLLDSLIYVNFLIEDPQSKKIDVDGSKLNQVFLDDSIYASIDPWNIKIKYCED